MSIAKALADLIMDSTTIDCQVYADGAIDSTDVQYPCLEVKVTGGESTPIGFGAPSYYVRDDSSSYYHIPVKIYNQQTNVHIISHVTYDGDEESANASLEMLETVRDFVDHITNSSDYFMFIDPDTFDDYGVYKIKCGVPLYPVLDDSNPPTRHKASMQLRIWHKRIYHGDEVVEISDVNINYLDYGDST